MSKFKIHYRGCDGRDTLTFASLSAVGRYVKARDQGSDYRRSHGLQDDFAFFSFEGFEWADLLDGHYFAHDAVYKSALLADVRLSFRERKMIVSVPGAPHYRTWEAKDGREKVGEVTAFAPGYDSEKPYVPSAGTWDRTPGPATATLKEAKAWLTGHIATGYKATV